MTRAPRKQTLRIDGPEGGLEALLESPAGGPPTAIALVLHPHPLHGGTMANKVAHTLARSFVAVGAAALRFNFRGVGASDGVHDDGVGEVDDACAAADWLRERHPGLPLYLGGFSFGAAVAVGAAARIEARGLVTVALPFARLGGRMPPPAMPWLVLHGTQDELIGLDALIAWLDERPSGPALEIVTGADHFFHGKLPEIRSAVERFLAPPPAPGGSGA